MDKIKFNGDLSKTSTKQLDYIREILKEHGYNKATKVNFEQVAVDTSANVKRIEIISETGNTFYMIAKFGPTEDSFQDMLHCKDLFKNEHIMYTEVLPKFTQLQIEANIPASERLRFAECYGSSMDLPDKVILLEDLEESHFAILHKFQSQNVDDTTKLVLKYLARFHSLSYILKAKDPETFNQFKSKLVNPREKYIFFFPIFGAFEQDIISKYGQKYKDAMMGTLSNLRGMMTQLSKSDSNSSFNVIEQGDAWTNNIMLNMQDGEPAVCCLIDYQMSRMNSPVADVYYMIFNCTDYETRGKYLLSWLDYYHSELGESLSKFGLELDTVYPRKQLDADLKRYAKLLLGLCVLMVINTWSIDSERIMMQEPVNTQELDTGTNTFQKRIKELMDSFIDFGFL